MNIIDVQFRSSMHSVLLHTAPGHRRIVAFNHRRRCQGQFFIAHVKNHDHKRYNANIIKLDSTHVMSGQRNAMLNAGLIINKSVKSFMLPKR